MPRDTRLVFQLEAEGRMQLSWPEAYGAQAYFVRVLEEQADQPLFEGTVEGLSCEMPAAMQGELTVELQPILQIGQKLRKGHTFRASGQVRWPETASLSCTAKEGEAHFAWSAPGEENYRLYRLEENGQGCLVCESTETEYVLTFGDGMDLSLPDYGVTLRYAAACVRADGDLVFSGALSLPVELTRSDLLGTRLQAACTELGDNQYTLSWNETKGDYYLVQYATDLQPDWQELVRVEPALEPGCTIRLRSGTNYRLRVSALTEEGTAAQSEEWTLTTGCSAIYAVIWPVEDLPLYSSTDRIQQIGTAAAAAACCVLAEENEMFYVHTPEGYGYLDSNLCLIDLGDFLGELCRYTITNSTSSLYTVHGYEIPEVTGTVIAGYEGVCTVEQRQLVPLLYPVAKKLAVAAAAALEDGFRLKIYDAYRPRVASHSIYSLTQRCLSDPIPSRSYSGEPVENLPASPPLLSDLPEDQQAAVLQALSSPESIEVGQAEAADGSAEQISQGLQAAVPEQENGLEETAASEAVEKRPDEENPEPSDQVLSSEQDPAAEPDGEETQEAQPLPAYLTYQQLMTGGRYRLGSFLAQNGSAHNLGIALDLTLERADTGEELEMQTTMHDLSHYATLQYNNENSDKLAEYMTGAGFSPLSTEWWHFQDDATRQKVGLKTYQEQGVTLEGWHKNDRGWYYCGPDGGILRSCTRTIHGTSYTFDSDGFAQVPWEPSPELQNQETAAK